METLNIIQASEFLGAHKETIRKLAATGTIPAAKIGRSWLFIKQDLVIYVRSKYTKSAISQGEKIGSEEKWRFTKEKQSGGSLFHIMDKEYSEALGLKAR